MATRLAAIAFALVAAVAIVAARPAAAAPSNALSSALSSLRSLSDGQFERVVGWSRSGAARPFVPSTPVERVEAQILDLPNADRNAVLAWLRGEGRAALHNRGASDSDIGGRRPAAMSGSVATPTPNPYRTLNFASETLGNRPVKGIVVLGGFAAAKRDGKAAIVCLSFKNQSQQVARRVLFEFALLGPQGREVGTLELDRRGEFSPGVDINGWQSLGEWQGGVGHRGYGDNCTFVEQGVASTPLLRAESVSYRVVDVEY